LTSASVEYVTVAHLDEVPPGRIVQVQTGDRWYALINVDGSLYAIDNSCPHNGGPLSRGMLNGRELTCPWHNWRWDVVSGRNCWPGTDWRVPRVPVKVLAGGEIQLPVI
jgi:nitrite reductase/ring-hydroxylating ferredoxin subunit